ncbi:hypothetical protein BOX15_Mlig019945g2, partial [Macrostomum lignano]
NSMISSIDEAKCVKQEKPSETEEEIDEASFHTANCQPPDSSCDGGGGWSRLSLHEDEAGEEKLIYSDAEDNEEELAAASARRKRAALRPTENGAPPAGVEPAPKKKRSRAWGLTKPAVVPVVITASVINEMLPNQTEPPATDYKDSPPVVDSIDVDVANKDEGEAASELEDGEVSPTNNNSNSNHNNSMTSQKKWLPTVLAESRDQTDRPKDQLGTQPATASVDAEQSLGRLSQFRRTVTRPCIFWCLAKPADLSEKLKKDLAAPLAPPPPPDPYESVFDVAALEAAAGVEQLRRDRRRLHPNSRPFPPDFEATGGRLPLPLDHSSGVDIADNGRRRRQQAPAVLHHFPRCMKPFEADELHQELSSSNCMPRAASEDDEAAVKLNWLDDSSRWPDALDKLRRQLAALLKVPFARAAVARLERPSDCTDWWHQSATSKDSGDAGSSPATPLAALVFVGGPPRPVEFRSRQRQSRGQQRRLHLAATRHGGLLVAEGSAVSDWAVRLPAFAADGDSRAAAADQAAQALFMLLFVRSEEQNESRV